MFSRGVSSHAKRTLERERPELTWDDTSLTLRLGPHTFVKRLVDGEFKTSCDCGKDEHCLHECLAFRMLQQICRRERWPYPGDSPYMISLKLAASSEGEPPAAPPPGGPMLGSSLSPVLSGLMPLVKLTPSKNPAPVVTLPPPSRDKAREKPKEAAKGREKPQEKPKEAAKEKDRAKPKEKGRAKEGAARPAPKAEKGEGKRPPQPTLVSLLSGKAATIQLILTVEADFHLPDGQVGLRFYTQTRKDALRQLLTLASLRNRAQEITSGQAGVYSWSEEDARFLKFIWPLLARRDVAHLDTDILALPGDTFQEWRRVFAAESGRFINRDDQKPLLPLDQSAPVGVAFQLSDHDAPEGMFRIQAQIIFPDGTRKYAWEVFSEAAKDPNAQVALAELYAALPVPKSTLDYFKGPITTLRKDKAVERLPPLLNYHLELLENGPCVSRAAVGKAASALVPVIAFSMQDNMFCIQCQIKGKAVPLASSVVNLTRGLHCTKRGKLVIDGVASTREAESAIHVLRELARNPNSTTTGDAVYFPNSLDSATFLAKAWVLLPSSLKKSATPELRGIFSDRNQNVILEPEFKLTDQDVFVKVEVSWRDVSGKFDLAPRDIANAMQNDASVVHDKNGRWLAIDRERASQIRQQLIDEGILTPYGSGGASLLRSDLRESLKKVAASLSTSKIPTADAESESFAERLLTEPVPELPPVPKHLDHLLRDYQRAGVHFLLDRALCRAGAILADDMGLGKTLQVLSLLETWRTAKCAEQSGGGGFSALVVSPATVIGVWLEQARAFCPELPIVAMTGPVKQRQKVFEENPHAVLVTHYGLVRSDIEKLKEREYEFVILDEAQNIKNPQAQATLAVKALSARHRIALTGTPLENRLSDLWSIMDFLNQGFLGDLPDFTAKYTSNFGLKSLGRRIAPLMLRRDKSTVAAELPPRTVILRSVELTDEQRAFYERELMISREAVKEAGPIEILSALTRLRQICCDPELFLKHPHEMGSGKLMLLLEQVEELLSTGHSVLVFSQFTQMLAIIQREFGKRGIPSRMITGETPVEDRARLVEEFNADETPSVMLLSLKAAGTGLTLTKADYVFLYDPWWNPAAENQAIDRTHRIGQTRPVFAYRLIAEETIEERVIAFMQAKQELFDAVVGGAAAEEVAGRLGRDELLRLLQ